MAECECLILPDPKLIDVREIAWTSKGLVIRHRGACSKDRIKSMEQGLESANKLIAEGADEAQTHHADAKACRAVLEEIATSPHQCLPGDKMKLCGQCRAFEFLRYKTAKGT